MIKGAEIISSEVKCSLVCSLQSVICLAIRAHCATRDCLHMTEFILSSSLHWLLPILTLRSSLSRTLGSHCYCANDKAIKILLVNKWIGINPAFYISSISRKSSQISLGYCRIFVNQVSSNVSIDRVLQQYVISLESNITICLIYISLYVICICTLFKILWRKMKT